MDLDLSVRDVERLENTSFASAFASTVDGAAAGVGTIACTVEVSYQCEAAGIGLNTATCDRTLDCTQFTDGCSNYCSGRGIVDVLVGARDGPAAAGGPLHPAGLDRSLLNAARDGI